MFKFIHAADIHLDSPRQGLDRDASWDAPVETIRHAPRRALENMVQLALEEEVDFVLIAGDLYDGDWQDFHTGLFFLSQLARLNEAGIHVVMIAGNHDATNRMTKSLRFPDPTRASLLSSRRPETIRFDTLGVAIHGQGFGASAVEADLARAYPAAMPGMFNIGMLHSSTTFSAGEHDRYAPCGLETLLSKSYDYWALGHIHKRQDLRRDEDEPPLFYPGNLQGRHVRETGAKGCTLVTVDDARRVTQEFRPVDVLRWEVCRVSAEGAADPEEIVDRVARHLRQVQRSSDGRPLAVRVEIRGACPAHRMLVAEPKRWQAELQAATMQFDGEPVWIERVIRNTSEPQWSAEQALANGPLDELRELIDELTEDEMVLHDFLREMEPIMTKLPAELTEGPTAFRLDDPEQLARLMADARDVVLERIRQRGTAV